MLKWASYGWRSVSIAAPLEERHADDMRPGRHRHPKLQVPVDAFVGVVVAHPVAIRRHGKELETLPVKGDFELVRLAQPFDVLVPVPHQADLDFVVSGARKGVVDDRAAARAEGQAVHVLFLREVGREVTTRIAGAAAASDRRRVTFCAAMR